MTTTSDDTDLAPLWGARAWQLAGLNAAAGLFLLASFGAFGIGWLTPDGCTSQVIDFHVFWSAARMALDGQPLAVFNQDALRSAFNPCTDTWLPWLHPAPALLLMLPFGLLPLVAAWATFNAVSLVALGAALRPFTQGISPIWLAFLLAPALLPALLAGQFVTLWMAGLLGAIWALRTERFAIAGILIGALTLKPTLGLMIPVALLAIGAWRTIAVTILTALFLHGAATLAYGFDYWSLLLETYGQHSMNGVRELGTVNTMTSLAAWLAQAGVPPVKAVQVNLGLAAILALIVFLIWRRNGPSDRAAAVLTAAIPLATPYLWHYDSAFLALTALFLLRACRYRPDPITGMLAVAFWLGAGLSLWMAATSLTDALTPLRTVPPLLLLAFAASLTHSLARPKEGR